MRDPITNELLPLHERSLGTIYRILSSESAKSLDAKFQRLPFDHPARGPYGIFKQAASNLWGNVFIGLGSRMNVFQNKLVDKITKYHDIDLELPGKQPCAYFCIISAQDTAYEFLSSLFFSMLFKRLSDYARKHGDERGRLPIEVNFVMDEFCNIGKLLDFKKTISVVRSYGINCQIIVQSIAQLSDRYPVKEWEEIVGNLRHPVGSRLQRHDDQRIHQQALRRGDCTAHRQLPAADAAAVADHARGDGISADENQQQRARSCIRRRCCRWTIGSASC